MKVLPKAVLLAFFCSIFSFSSFAADHVDSPAAINDPAADLTDVYAWMNSDATKLNLILNVTTAATVDSQFSDAVQYVFHVNSSTAFGETATETLIICTFDASQQIQCWAGSDEYLTGDASNTQGITSASGKLKVFAGLRNDPFFFNLEGFNATVEAVVAAAPGLTFDDAGCPELNAVTAATLVDQLQTDAEGETPADFFAALNVLSLVVQVDIDVVNSGGPILGVWASTHRVDS